MANYSKNYEEYYQEISKDIKTNENKLKEIMKKITKEEKKSKFCNWGMALSALFSIGSLALIAAVPGLASLFIPLAVIGFLPASAFYVNADKFGKRAEKIKIDYNRLLNHNNYLIETKEVFDDMDRAYRGKKQDEIKYEEPKDISINTNEKEKENVRR